MAVVVNGSNAAFSMKSLTVAEAAIILVGIGRRLERSVTVTQVAIILAEIGRPPMR